MRLAVLVLCAVSACAGAQVPAGAELSIRLTDRVASEIATPQAAHAVLVAPVIADGQIVLPSGLILTGAVKQAKAASATERAQMQLVFTEISDGRVKVPLAAVVGRLENARETLDDKGAITGINQAESYGGRLSQGIAKLEASDRFAALASMIQGAKQALKIEDVNANIDYDSGVELTLKLTAALNWTGSVAGPEAKLQAFPGEDALPDLVNRQPFRTRAANPPKPSDITNLMLIGTEQELRAAFEKAGWSSAAQLDANSKLETARALIEDRGYKEGPMSVLLLDGKAPDMSWQKGNNTFAMRHHLRIFRRPETLAGKPVWVCSSTHDAGIDFSDRDHTFIHKVDADIDVERAKVVSDLIFTGLVKSVALADRPDVPTAIENATGDSMKTDGRMAIILF